MRIAIANDVQMAVECLRRTLTHQGKHHVAWVAENGAQAVSLCARDTPDLVLMDLNMPIMNGVEATKYIMQRSPCPILVVTSSVSDHASSVFEAMGHGALDAVDTPFCEVVNGVSGGVRLLSKIDVVARLSQYDAVELPKNLSVSHKPVVDGAVPLIVIGASSGGPQALACILSRLPEDLAAAVVVVQHVDARFAGEMVDWLNRHTRLLVKAADSNDTPQPGTVLVAQTDDHLILTPSDGLRYTLEPMDLVYRPSIDVFFNSVAKHWRGDVLGVLLTGMGRDGAEGLLELRRLGYCTLAQDEATSTVYGMPKAAADMGAAEKILPLDYMAVEISGWAGCKLYRGVHEHHG